MGSHGVEIAAGRAGASAVLASIVTANRGRGFVAAVSAEPLVRRRRVHIGPRADGGVHWPRLPTPFAITSTEMTRAEVDSMPIRIFARVESGMVSVGLNAEELVNDTYR